MRCTRTYTDCIVALRNEKGSYNYAMTYTNTTQIVALRNEKGSYNGMQP